MTQDNKISGLVDMHCHVDLYRYPGRIVRECDRLRIRTVAVTTTPKAWPGNNRFTKDSQYVRPSLGLHPEIAYQRADELPIFKRYLPEARYVGEIGLDGRGPNRSGMNEQISVLTQILKACSNQGHKILSLHGTAAWPKLLDLLEDQLDFSTCKAVLHWFTGSKKQSNRAIKMGCYFSLNKNQFISAKYHNILLELPPEKILTETDGPFLKEGSVPAVPKDVYLTVEYCARLWGISSSKASLQIIENLRGIVS